MKLTLFLLIIFITHANIKAQNYTFSKDNCIELSQNQMEEFGFIFKKNEIIYKSRDEELFYTFIIKKGNVETIIDIKSEENDTIKYTNNITPYFVSNENLKLFHSRNVLNQELIPIIINNSIKNHEKQIIFFFPYSDLEKNKLFKNLNLENFILSSNIFVCD